jgi:hypothetical protein
MISLKDLVEILSLVGVKTDPSLQVAMELIVVLTRIQIRTRWIIVKKTITELTLLGPLLIVDPISKDFFPP